MPLLPSLHPGSPLLQQRPAKTQLNPTPAKLPGALPLLTPPTPQLRSRLFTPLPPLGQSPASCCCHRVPRAGLTWHLRQVRAWQLHEHMSRERCAKFTNQTSALPEGRPPPLSGTCARQTSSQEDCGGREAGFPAPPWGKQSHDGRRVPRCLQTQLTRDFQDFAAAGKGLACGQLCPHPLSRPSCDPRHSVLWVTVCCDLSLC